MWQIAVKPTAAAFYRAVIAHVSALWPVWMWMAFADTQNLVWFWI